MWAEGRGNLGWLSKRVLPTQPDAWRGCQGRSPCLSSLALPGDNDTVEKVFVRGPSQVPWNLSCPVLGPGESGRLLPIWSIFRIVCYTEQCKWELQESCCLKDIAWRPHDSDLNYDYSYRVRGPTPIGRLLLIKLGPQTEVLKESIVFGKLPLKNLGPMLVVLEGSICNWNIRVNIHFDITGRTQHKKLEPASIFLVDIRRPVKYCRFELSYIPNPLSTNTLVHWAHKLQKKPNYHYWCVSVLTRSSGMKVSPICSVGEPVINLQPLQIAGL